MASTSPREYVETEVAKIFSYDHPEEARRCFAYLKQLEESYDLDDPVVVEQAVMKDVRQAALIRKAMSPPDALGLPPLLEARRWEHGIPDGAFMHQPVFDRVTIHQIAQWSETKATKGGIIYLSEAGRKREEQANPEGIVVAAGLRALDDLRSNGIDLGHRVSFVINAPYRRRVESIEGKEMYVILCRSGDINGSYDLSQSLRLGELRIQFDEAKVEHYLVRGDAKINRGQDPLHSEFD